MKQACVIATICEFLGAFLGGSHVADTIRAGIADYKCFAGQPELLMYGNLCVLIMVGVWLILATKYEMPVSTTHSCVGGMVGMTIVAKGGDCVVWAADGNEDNLWIPKGIASIVLSWVISPVLSGIFAAALYGAVRFTILRAQNSFEKVTLVLSACNQPDVRSTSAWSCRLSARTLCSSLARFSSTSSSS